MPGRHRPCHFGIFCDAGALGIVRRMDIRVFFAAAVAGFVCAAVAAAEPGSWPPPGVSFYGDPGAPDISGLWLGTAMHVPGSPTVVGNRGTADGRPPTYWAPWPLPYTPAYQKI